MNREQLRAVIAASVGDPSVGPVAEVVDTIADAVHAALNPPAASVGYEPI
jgi:hypothetical protein